MSRPIYTRRGDTGETSLAGGLRVPKTSARIEAIGTLDEANSAIGHARAALSAESGGGGAVDLAAMLDFAQHRLFNVAGHLATPVAPSSAPARSIGVTEDDVARLESAIDALAACTADLVDFVLPGGCESAARLHVARTVVRRAERRVLDLAASEPVDGNALAFINRLSDLLFAAARYENRDCGDVTWDPEK